MGTIIGEYIWATIGIHSPIPYQAPDREVPRRESGSRKTFVGAQLGGILGPA